MLLPTVICWLLRKIPTDFPFVLLQSRMVSVMQDERDDERLATHAVAPRQTARPTATLNCRSKEKWGFSGVPQKLTFGDCWTKTPVV